MKRIILYNLISFVALGLFLSCNNDETDEEKLIKLTSKDYIDGAYFDGILYYKVISNTNSNVEISKAQQSVEEVSVPTKIIINEKEYTVTSIGINAFQNCSNLKTIVIPEKVTSIGESAFSGCSGLPTVIIPDNVTAISNNTFSGCTGLSSITIPSRITSIGDYAFWGCTGLTSICIPESVVSIGGNAFDGCSGLKKVIVPNISAWCRIAFSNQTSNPLYYAHHLYINDGSTELKDLIIPNNITSISQNAFYGCSGLTSVVIPDNVTSIGNHAFSRCDGIASLSLPSSVKSIGNYAFESCIGLSSLYVFCSPTTIGDNIFYNCEKLKEAVFDCKIVTPILKGNHYLKKVSIAEGVTSIGDYAFYNCTKLETLKVTNSKDPNKSYYTELRSIPESVTSIGDYAFAFCAGLPYFASSNGLESIGAHAFEFTNLECFIVGKNVKSLGELAFYKTSVYPITIIFCCGPAPQATYDTFPECYYFEHNNSDTYIYIVKDFVESYKSTYPWNKLGNYVYTYSEEMIWLDAFDICKYYLDDYLDNR